MSSSMGSAGGYNFRKIQTVPTHTEFIDIVLSKTQRKTPTVIHKGYDISRIRHFYMRKVKFTQQSFDEKLTQILSDFPKLDDIHPFYADLMNILYDRDHYKLALGQVNTARHLVDRVSKDYVRMLKFGDSLYRCKQLKIAALGRMATIMKKQKDCLVYLEQVRQHLSRLPTIDPNARTLLLCGYPNVGKSSFMNKLTKANVDVQPYAFTTKSLFVGHMDYRYLRWQVIDTPGVLDHPLEERNTIEMQSITALAHLRACVLYFVDLSESCGYTLQQQITLFQSIQPLFQNKTVMIVVNKIDLKRLEQLSGEDRSTLQALLDSGILMMPCSCITEEGVMAVKEAACDRLLGDRVTQKISVGGKRIEDVLNRLHLAVPKARDNVERPAFVPQLVLDRRVNASAAQERMEKTERELEEDGGGAGIYSVDLRKRYLLADSSWKYDPIPEIFNGKNVADYVDPEIEEHLQALELEEEHNAAEQGSEDEQLESEEHRSLRQKAKIIRDRQLMLQLRSRARHSRGIPSITAKQAVRRFAAASADHRSVQSTINIDSAVESITRGLNLTRDRGMHGLRDQSERARSEGIRKRSQRPAASDARRGEADRKVYNLRPKHLLSGKRTLGTHNRR